MMRHARSAQQMGLDSITLMVRDVVRRKTTRTRTRTRTKSERGSEFFTEPEAELVVVTGMQRRMTIGSSQWQRQAAPGPSDYDRHGVKVNGSPHQVTRNG